MRLRRTLLAAATSLVCCVASADTFGRVYYDASKDELVLTMIYRGTNADHSFSLNWGECMQHDDGTASVNAEVLDSQARDAARQDFKKTVHLALDAMPCRPAKLTLHTAPRFYYSLPIPASPAH